MFAELYGPHKVDHASRFGPKVEGGTTKNKNGTPKRHPKRR